MKKNESESIVKLYFPHDYCAIDDENITNLLYKYNWAGYGIYWRIIELLHQNGNEISSTNIGAIAFRNNIEETLLKNILNEKSLFEFKDGVYSSDRVNKNLELFEEKKKIKQDAAIIRWSQTKKKKEILEFYKSEYKKVFKELPTIMEDEINTLYQISKFNEDFKEKLPKVLERLSKIKFTKEYSDYMPLSTWLLTDKNYSKVANGEFNKKKENEIRAQIEASVEKIEAARNMELSEAEKLEIKNIQNRAKEEMKIRNLKKVRDENDKRD